LANLYSELPALLILGPRASGKTTTVKRLASSIVRLDFPAEATAFNFDPDAALMVAKEPVLLDEWQEVPELMGAVRRAIDLDPSPEKFLLTGSARPRKGTSSWSGKGRVVDVTMYGLTGGEQLKRGTSMSVPDYLSNPVLTTFLVRNDPPDMLGYLDLALRGGFPESALRLGDRARQAWLEAYIDQLVHRDASNLDGARDPVLLSSFSFSRKRWTPRN
jgi:predicted AAA+ superfamily ATPase